MSKQIVSVDLCGILNSVLLVYMVKLTTPIEVKLLHFSEREREVSRNEIWLANLNSGKGQLNQSCFIPMGIRIST